MNRRLVLAGEVRRVRAVLATFGAGATLGDLRSASDEALCAAEVAGGVTS